MVVSVTGFRIGNLAVDCNDLEGMTSFWAALTGLSTMAGDETFAILGDPEHPGRLKLFMQKVPEPRVGKNRLHIDLYVADQAAAWPGWRSSAAAWWRRTSVTASPGRWRPTRRTTSSAWSRC